MNAFTVSKCRHRKRVKTIRLDESERAFLEERARMGRNVNEQIRALVQAEMRRAGVKIPSPLV